MFKKSKISIFSPFPPQRGGMATLAECLAIAYEKNGHKVLRKKLNSGFKVLFILPILYFQFLLVIIKSDLIHIISSSGNSLWLKDLPAIIIAKFLKKKVVLNFVGGRAIENFELWGLHKKLPFYLADIVVVPSNVLKNKIIKENKKIKIIKIPHMVDIKKFFKNRKKIQLNPPILLVAKSIESYSGHELLLEIFVTIKLKIKNAELWIAGTGNKESFLRKKVEKLSLKGVRFLGNIDHHEMPKIMEKSTILVHATKYESFGIALVEAMAAGLPVISFNIGGIPEVVINNKTGYLIPYGDKKIFSEKILTILNNKNKFKKMSSVAEKESKKFLPISIYKLWSELYNHL